MLNNYFPNEINSGPWVMGWTLNRLRELPETTEFVLPVCSLTTSYEECADSGDWLLSPVYHEALTSDLQRRIVRRIRDCFPTYSASHPATSRDQVRIIEFPQQSLPHRMAPKVVAFSVDTAIEEHGPHLPLGTDTIQSYAVLRALQNEVDGVDVFRPLDYGQLTWGLPFGFSVDLTTKLLTEYVAGFASAVTNWLQPEALYVVDVHGSITHRRAIVEGLRRSGVRRWKFRWLHEPLAEFASGRGDQHAGGVETALVELANNRLIDSNWFPSRLADLAAGQMSFQKAVELTSDLAAFTEFVRKHQLNGIIGDILNYQAVDASLMFDRMLQTARADIKSLFSNDSAADSDSDAGRQLW